MEEADPHVAMPHVRVPHSYRGDPLVPRFPDDRPIIVFDGYCALCSGFVQFVLRHDARQHFRFLAAQSPLGASIYRHYQLDPIDYPTNVLLEAGVPWFKSEGSIRMFEKLGWPWSLMALGRLLPLACRDWLYDLIARNRLRWFGVRTTCFLPSAENADRFLG
jgi:predicted DCC family thiol-disulfide oxidoreductase YuxK